MTDLTVLLPEVLVEIQNLHRWASIDITELVLSPNYQHALDAIRDYRAFGFTKHVEIVEAQCASMEAQTVAPFKRRLEFLLGQYQGETKQALLACVALAESASNFRFQLEVTQ